LNHEIPDLARMPLSMRSAITPTPNAELEQRFWEWKSAIEQIPQSGTQPSNLVIFAGVPITHGSTAFDERRSRLPTTDERYPLPSKLGVAAQRALDDAKAAGVRFQKTKYELRNRVIGAYYDYAYPPN